MEIYKRTIYRKQLIYQGIFWVTIFFFYWLHYNRMINIPGYVFLFSSKEVMIGMLSFYLWREDWLKVNPTFLRILSAVSLWLIAIFVLWSFATYLLCYMLRSSIGTFGSRFDEYLTVITRIGPLGIIKEWRSFTYEILVLFILSLSPRMLKMIFEGHVNKLILQRDRVDWELNLLKSEINPTLLFNTLNHTYLLLDEDSEKGKDLIIKLSNLMRYSLYDSKSQFIKLSTEIEFVENYLFLMKECFTERLEIDWDIEKSYEPFKIIPLLILPLINTSISILAPHMKERDKVWVEIKVIDCDLLLIVKRMIANGLGESHVAHMYRDEDMEVMLVKNRLDRFYKRQFELLVTKLPEEYRLDLRLNLKSL